MRDTGPGANAPEVAEGPSFPGCPALGAMHAKPGPKASKIFTLLFP